MHLHSTYQQFRLLKLMVEGMLTIILILFIACLYTQMTITLFSVIEHISEKFNKEQKRVYLQTGNTFEY